ncbi:protein kinase family protein [Chryseobacterium daeguense]|uniref:protein kinase family protein n=1 Tax=Chryseobacterium daeguense TaxID=412438 RepID=UPI00040CFFE2|nr:protein kinase family protein [Chryseobacterium daeguense]
MFTNTLLTFHLGDSIGEGGEATVYKAFDTQLNADIVIKKISKTRFKGDLNKYFEESQKLYLSSHHNVVKIMYGCQDDEFIYLAMPLYVKGSLKSIYDERFLTCREIIRYSLQFLSGLNYIHSKQLLHYDIKPENILIDDTDKASVSDFGLAKYLGLYGFATVEGTTEELAPPEYFSQAAHNINLISISLV